MFKRVDTNETGTTTTYYVAGGGHEVVTSGTTVTHKTYIGGAAVVLETTSTPASASTVYLLHDHLGSTDVITDSSGNVQTRYSFDAWGARRNVTWAAFLGGTPASLWQTALTTRGYTNHEQLDEVGLVHMNGRVYDPQLGRFLSADPVVQDATDLQAYNHYSYVRNNPLSLTDPSGFSWLGGIFNAIGKFFTGVFKAIESAVKAILSSSIFRAVIQIAACAFGGPIGCVAAAGGLSLASGGTPLQALEAMAFAGISIAVWTNVGNMLQGAADMTRVLVHGVVNGALRMAQGGSFLNGFAIGAAGEGADVGMKEGGLYSVAGDEGKFLRTSIAGVAGGTASVLTGGKFANGAVSAAFGHLFNAEGIGHNGGPPLEDEGSPSRFTWFFGRLSIFFTVLTLSGDTPQGAVSGSWDVIYFRGEGAAFGPLPDGYVMVSRWVSTDEVNMWLGNQGTSIPSGVGDDRVYVTTFGAPQPGGTGPARIDFAVPQDALMPAGNTSWFQIFQPAQSTPIYNVRIYVPKG
ncbi:MAG: RHS repeat domain-containing protein [Rhodomicrobium sp.]